MFVCNRVFMRSWKCVHMTVFDSVRLSTYQYVCLSVKMVVQIVSKYSLFHFKAMVQGQQTVQYLRQPNGQLIPIGVAPPIAMSSNATPTNASSVMEQSATDKLSSTASSSPETSATKAPKLMAAATTTNSSSSSSTLLAAVTTNSSLTTTVTLPTVTTTPSARTVSMTPQVIASTVPQQSQLTTAAAASTVAPVPVAAASTTKAIATPQTMVPQIQPSTQIQATPMTTTPAAAATQQQSTKQQFQTVQLTWENHQKLAKVIEEMKKFQGQKLTDKQMKQYQQLQVEQQKILAEGKPVSVVPSERMVTSTPTDPQSSASTSSSQIAANNQFVNVNSTQSIVQPQQPVMVQTQAGAPTPAAATATVATTQAISSVSTTPSIIRPPGVSQVMMGTPSAPPPTSQQSVSITIGPRMPGTIAHDLEIHFCFSMNLIFRATLLIDSSKRIDSSITHLFNSQVLLRQCDQP